MRGRDIAGHGGFAQALQVTDRHVAILSLTEEMADFREEGELPRFDPIP
jgi:hypothetical protein